MYNFAAFLLTITLPFSYRIRTSDWVFGSISLFDLSLILLSILMLPFFKFRYHDIAFLGVVRFDPTRHYKRNGQRLFLLLAAPLLVGCISLAWAQNFVEPSKYIVSFAEALLAYFFAATVFEALGPHATARAAGTIVLLLLIGSLLSYLNMPGFDPEEIYFQSYPDEKLTAFLASYYSRLSHPFIGLSNAFASVLSFFIFLLWTYGRASGKKQFIYLSGLAFMAVVATFSRGVLIAVILAGIVFIKVQHVSIRVTIQRVIGAFTLVLGLLLFMFLAPEGRGLAGYDLTVMESLELRMSDENISSRWDVIDFAFERIAERPILGFGAGVTADNSSLLEGSAHNTYIEQILNYGIPLGLLICVSFILVMLHFFDTRQLTAVQKIMSKGIGVAVLAQLMIFLSQASFEGYLLKVIYYFSIGMGVAMIRSANNIHDVSNGRQ